MGFEDTKLCVTLMAPVHHLNNLDKLNNLSFLFHASKYPLRPQSITGFVL